METYNGFVRTPQDAIKLFEACRQGLLPRVQRRLSEKERQSIRSGSVFVWDEREAGMRRWTDGKSWSASRVSGSFLTYREMEGKRGSGFGNNRRTNGRTPDSGGRVSDEDQGDEPEGYRYKADGLLKQSFSITTQAGQHLHLISYYSRPQHGPQEVLLPSTDPALRNVVPPKGMYPESSLQEQHPPAMTRTPMRSYNNSPPPQTRPYQSPPEQPGYAYWQQQREPQPQSQPPPWVRGMPPSPNEPTYWPPERLTSEIKAHHMQPHSNTHHPYSPGNPYSAGPPHGPPLGPHAHPHAHPHPHSEAAYAEAHLHAQAAHAQAAQAQALHSQPRAPLSGPPPGPPPTQAARPLSHHHSPSSHHLSPQQLPLRGPVPLSTHPTVYHRPESNERPLPPPGPMAPRAYYDAPQAVSERVSPHMPHAHHLQQTAQATQAAMLDSHGPTSARNPQGPLPAMPPASHANLTPPRNHSASPPRHYPGIEPPVRRGQASVSSLLNQPTQPEAGAGGSPNIHSTGATVANPAGGPPSRGNNDMWGEDQKALKSLNRSFKI